MRQALVQLRQVHPSGAATRVRVLPRHCSIVIIVSELSTRTHTRARAETDAYTHQQTHTVSQTGIHMYTHTTQIPGPVQGRAAKMCVWLELPNAVSCGHCGHHHHIFNSDSSFVYINTDIPKNKSGIPHMHAPLANSSVEPSHTQRWCTTLLLT